MSDKRFVNVTPSESGVDKNRIENLYRSHKESCIVCEGETQTDTEYSGSGSEARSYSDERYVCLDCERMVTEIEEDFIEFYLTNADIEDIFGRSPDNFRDHDAISVM